MTDNLELGRMLAAVSAFEPSADLAVEVRCRSLDDLRVALGIVAAPPDDSNPTAFIPGRVFGIPIIEDPEMRPGEVRAYNAQGRLILHRLPPPEEPA